MTVHKVKQQAKWVTPEETKKQKANPNCYLHYRGLGHQVKDYLYLPAHLLKVQAKSTKAIAIHTLEVCKDKESETNKLLKNK
jgi:hypothetical protein